MEIDQTLDVHDSWILDRLVLAITIGLFIGMITLTTGQVFIRTLSLDISADWTVPLARFSLIPATYFGAAVASRNREHIRMTYLLDKLNEKYPKVRYVFDVLSSIIVIAFTAFVFIATAPLAYSEWTSNLGGVGWLSSGHLYLGIAMGLGLMLIYEVMKFYNDNVIDILANMSGGNS